MKHTIDTTSEAPTRPQHEIQEQLVAETARLLLQDDVRSQVFDKLHSIQAEQLKELAGRPVQTANGLAFCPRSTPGTKAARDALLGRIKDEITALTREIEKNSASAGSLMKSSILHAKAIGDRLNYVKAHKLVRHGQWRTWLKNNFSGSYATATGYMRLARPENWTKVARRLHSSNGITLRNALNIVREGIPKENSPTQSSSGECVKLLTDEFRQMIARWPTRALLRLHGNRVAFMEAIRDAGRELNRKVVESVRAHLVNPARP